jgi:zinc/manganese transport system substrate-binding protein
MILRVLFVVLVLLSSEAVAAAALNLVATSASMGALAREIGGDDVRVTVLAPPDRDIHQLQAKPSMIRALRSADLVVAVGAELEAGWLPVAIPSAANPDILPGRDGYFEAAAQLDDLLDTDTAADRALGDVHPLGNPHVNLDPVRMARVGEALAHRLGALDQANAERYQARAATFGTLVAQRVAEWQRETANAPGVLLFHRDAVYLLDRLGVPLLGEIEPIPGVPATATHLKRLTDDLAGRRGIVIYPVFQASRAPEKLAGDLGWPVVKLPLDPPLDASGAAYLALIEAWVDAIASVPE